MLVLAFGFLVLNNPASVQNIGGIGIAVLGMMFYGYAENQDKVAEVRLSTTSA
jgi:solute carrier family 35 protein E3